MILTDAQIRQLQAYFPDNANQLIEAGNVNEVLLQLDILTVALTDSNYEPTAESLEVERFRDNVYWQNTHEAI